jgi:hypothetical protein
MASWRTGGAKGCGGSIDNNMVSIRSVDMRIQNPSGRWNVRQSRLHRVPSVTVRERDSHSKSPESETTVVNFLSCSRVLDMVSAARAPCELSATTVARGTATRMAEMRLMDQADGRTKVLRDDCESVGQASDGLDLLNTHYGNLTRGRGEGEKCKRSRSRLMTTSTTPLDSARIRQLATHTADLRCATAVCLLNSSKLPD